MIAVRLASTPVCHVCCADEASLQTAQHPPVEVDYEQAVQKQCPRGHDADDEEVLAMLSSSRQAAQQHSTSFCGATDMLRPSAG